ncbi:cilia- and flagella-associated protein 61 [Lycorma delicatula]|uniref:cilia- and flagella-associated protein 61 n=1 Tax=Lycorma delicatula TaxID=130591 RepID=UPI003F515251
MYVWLSEEAKILLFLKLAIPFSGVICLASGHIQPLQLRDFSMCAFSPTNDPLLCSGEEDNIDIMPLLDRTAPKLRKIYGDYLVSELVRFSSDTRDGLTGLLNNKAVGFLLLNKNVCYATINEYFEVVMYNGFCKKHCDDYVPEKRFTGIIEEINIDVPNDILDVEEKIADEVKEHGQEHADSVGSDTDEVESLESEDVSYLADLDDDERFGYTFPPVVCPGANFQTHSKSRLSCVNLESSEIALKSKLVAHARGPRRDSIPIKYGFPLPIKYNDLYVGADFLGEGNAVIIEMFVLEDSANTSFCFDFLEAVFEAASDKEYCIICAPSNLPTPPFINLFTKVCPKVGKLFPQELYFLHRNVLLGQLRVREAFRGDESAILQLISGLEKSRTILMDFIDSVVSSTSDLKSYVLLSEDVVTGICIISVTGFDIRLLEGQFDIDKHLTSALHSQYAYIKHAFICPNLSVRGKFFFREVLRFSSNTVLFYTLFEEELYKSEEVQLTVPNIIESLTPVAPRQQLQYPPEIERKESSIFTADGREIRVQIEDNMATIREVQEFEKEPPFALYFTTIKKLPFSSSHKKIVIVGGSETAISFLETLIFRSAGNVKYTNVMLVSPHGFPYNQKPHKAADLMCVYTGRYNHRFMTQLGLRTYINVVYGYMTAINREEKTIVIDYDKTLPYDYLFLFCGVQCSKPLPHNVQKDRQKPLYHYNS